MLVEEYPFNEASEFANGNTTDLIKTVLQHVDKHGRKDKSIENTTIKLNAVDEILKIYSSMGMLDYCRFAANITNKNGKVYLYVTYQVTKVITIESRYPKSWPIKSSKFDWPTRKLEKSKGKWHRQLRERVKQEAARKRKTRYGINSISLIVINQ